MEFKNELKINIVSKINERKPCKLKVKYKKKND